MIRMISERLTVADVLAECGIDHNARRGRLPCPIHGGDGLNFAIHDEGRAWTCHSRHCGEGRRRDAINLYTLLRHGAPLPDLDDADKRDALRRLADMAHVNLDDFHSNAPPPPRNRFARIPRRERARLVAIFDDTSRLGEIAADGFTDRTAEMIVLYLGVAASEGALPPKIDRTWNLFDRLEKFSNGKR